MKNEMTGTRHKAQGTGVTGALCPVPCAFFIVGPTAVGKSAFAVEVASRLKGEIISCDSMQVYREITIASDRPSEAMLRNIPHHLIGVISVEEEFNVARYRELALQALKDIQARGKVPVFCGGSGLYMMAVLDGLLEGGEVDGEIRARLMREADEKGTLTLHDRLKEGDPVAAGKIGPNDRNRIIRALEVLEMTGEPISVKQKKRDGLWGKEDVRIVVLNRPRAELYRRAEARIDGMFKQGLVDEVREVLKKRLMPTASRLIGIPEVRGFLEGRHDLAEASSLMKKNTRHYIKRQLTWFRKEKRAKWIEIDADMSDGDVADLIMKEFKEH